VVGGQSFANFQEVQLPGNVLNFSTSQIFARDGLLPLPELTGTEDCLAVGVGPNILPFSAGSFLCETVLDTVIEPGMPDPPAPLAVAPPGRAPAAAPARGWTTTQPAPRSPARVR
jgi:hypothetical protein